METPSIDCLVCHSHALENVAGGRTLMGGTTKADKLNPFLLMQCQDCGHVQKALDHNWHSAMDGLYERHYDDYRVVGRQVNFVDGKIVGRDGLAVRKLDTIIGLGDRGTMLDVGCGAGRFLEAFGQEKPGWSLAGYDVGDLHKEHVLTIPGARFFHGLGTLATLDERFDLITLNHVVEHLTDPVTVMREVGNLLSPGGHLVIRVPSFAAVNSDFFLLEHCSHFTMETLTHALRLAGLKVTQEINDLSAIELGVVAVRDDQASAGSGTPDVKAIREKVSTCLAWAESLPGFVRDNKNGHKAGILGVGGAGLWLGVLLRGELDFYVDEDPGKQGHQFAGCPILPGSAIPPGSIVFVTFNNPEASRGLCERLRANHPDKSFLAPPALTAGK